jgi:hypothetical protein
VCAGPRRLGLRQRDHGTSCPGCRPGSRTLDVTSAELGRPRPGSARRGRRHGRPGVPLRGGAFSTRCQAETMRSSRLRSVRPFVLASSGGRSARKRGPRRTSRRPEPGWPSRLKASPELTFDLRDAGSKAVARPRGPARAHDRK